LEQLKEELNKIFNIQSFEKIQIDNNFDIPISDTFNFQNFQPNNELSKKLNKLKKLEAIY